MRVAIIYFKAGKRNSLELLSREMARKWQAVGHQVEVMEAKPGEDLRLARFDYVVLGTESSSLWGKLPTRLPQVLSQAGQVAGKRSFAFVCPSGFRTQKLLSRLMKAMENEGMLVNYAEILSSVSEASLAAEKVPLQRP